jgi:hypothetical protein
MIITERWMLGRLEWPTHLNWMCEKEHLAREWEKITKQLQFLRLNYGVLAVTTILVYTKHEMYSGESTALGPVKANTERYQNTFPKFRFSSWIYEHETAKVYLLSKYLSYHQCSSSSSSNNNNNNNNNNNKLQSAELQLYSIGGLIPLIPGSSDVSSDLKHRANDARDS